MTIVIDLNLVSTRTRRKNVESASSARIECSWAEFANWT